MLHRQWHRHARKATRHTLQRRASIGLIALALAFAVAMLPGTLTAWAATGGTSIPGAVNGVCQQDASLNVACGASSTATGFGSTASGTSSTATGSGSTATGTSSTATGGDSTATGTSSTATGTSSTATGSDSTATGAGSAATGSDSTATGTGSAATGANSVSLGANSTDNGTPNVVSVGSSTQQRRIINVAPGTIATGSTDVVNGGQLFVTQQTLTAVQNAVNSLIASGLCTTVNGGVACGPGAKAATPGSVAIGSGAQALGDPTVAIGQNAVATGSNAIALGTNAQASGTSSVALGADAVASGANSVALGAGSVASRNNTVDIGGRQLTSVAAGTAGTDAVNVNQLNQAEGSLSTQISQMGAMTMAATQVTGTAAPGKTRLGVGVANVGGQTAVALGVTHTPQQHPNTQYSCAASTTVGQNQVGVTCGFSLQF